LRGRCGATARSSLYKMKAKEPKTKPDEAVLAADSDRERSQSPVMLSAIHTPDIEPHDANSNSQQYLSMRSIRRCDMRVLPHHAGRLLLYHRAVHRAIIAPRCPSNSVRQQHCYPHPARVLPMPGREKTKTVFYGMRGASPIWQQARAGDADVFATAMALSCFSLNAVLRTIGQHLPKKRTVKKFPST